MRFDAVFLHDPLYGGIGLAPHEVALVRTPEFVRLHYLRQLGFTFLAFPSALSTRFEHSLGVLRNADLIARHLLSEDSVRFTDDDIATLRAAAALHDIGHGPFSHFFEKILRLLGRPVDQAKVSAEIVRSSGPIREALAQGGLDYIRVADIIDPDEPTGVSPGDRLFRKIVSGDVDADRIDYLLRDCFFTGLPQGISPDRTIRALTAQTVPLFAGPVLDLFLKEESLELADALLMARLSLRQHVWTDPVNRCAETLVFQAVELAVEQGAPGSTLRGLRGESFAEKFRIWTDDDLLAELVRAGGQSEEIVRSLTRGNLFTHSVDCRFPDLSQAIKDSLLAIDKKLKDDRIRELHGLERAYAEIISAETGLPVDGVLVDFPELGYMQEVKQKILLRNGSYALLSDRSVFAAHLNELFRDYYRAHAFLRAPGLSAADADRMLRTIRTVMEQPGIRR